MKYALLLPILLALGASAADQGTLQRYTQSLLLGDTMEQILQVYPPLKKWPKTREPKSKFDRIHMERESAKDYPAEAEEMILGMRFGKLVHVQVIFTEEYSRRKPLEKLVVDLSLMYGEPRRVGEVYAWWDGSTAVVASNVPAPGEEGDLRTSFEMMEKPLLKALYY
ncbi:MAG: hypothetical protein A2X36_09065 [Elusimicrobia bacterium GWA2_69_24]|nr:MAG: hypothetical protein A2X36_09065 [Elusimicrobia bacterium GWA2_69_24]HBL17018.1 hypothetical protein [Elusimicrobiota bacterium]